MLQQILIYLTIGISITWLYDEVLKRTQPEDMQFNNIERIVVTIIWPISILWTIYSIASNRKRNKDDE